MSVTLQARTRIKHDGKQYLPGELVKGVELAHAQRLVNLNAAIFTHEAILADEDDLKTPNNTKNDGDLDIEDDLGGLSGIDDMTDEEVAALIDKHFKLDLLKEEAADIGMQFPGNISKTNLIELILEEEQEQHFLDLIPE